MPPTHIALLRGINVVGANRVSMADLRDLMEAISYRDVRTVLNSGNVVFSPGRTRARHDRRIESALRDRLGLNVRVAVLRGTELREIIESNPLARLASNPSRMQIVIPMDTSAISRLETLTRREWAPEAIALGPRAVYAWCPDGIAESKLYEQLYRMLGPSTTRTASTMAKLLALVGMGR